MTVQPLQYCIDTGKLRYPDEDAALARGRQLQRADPEHRPRYAYQCQACGDYHLTMYHEFRPRAEGDAPRAESWQHAWLRAGRGEVVQPSQEQVDPPDPA
jgi:hypothetical protein